MYKLTKGALEKMVDGNYVHEPIVQVLKYRKSSSKEEEENVEYKLVLFDGDHIYFSAVLSPPLNSLITENVLTDFSICKIKKYTVTCTQKRKRVIILNLDIKVPGSKVGGKVHDLDDPIDSNSKKEVALQVPQPSTSDTNISTIPISALNSCCKNWVIKAKVIAKSPIKTWHNPRGCGQMFYMDLEDGSGEIRCTAFDKECDTFFNVITIGKVYYFSKAVIKPAKQFIKNNYEILLARYSQIVLCNEKQPSNLVFNFTSLSDLNEKQNNDVVDVLAIIESCGMVQRVRGRSGDMNVKEIQLTDKSNTIVKLSLWDSYATTFCGKSGQILAVKEAKIRNFNTQKLLSTTKSTIFEIDPDIPEAHNLRA
ncbi:replication protein A 70 kDa DNA-binding subunit-like [Ceratina calcarata]|uniref:Replication protein A 70 kDa DNA-binding subunit n=1 Tax=Ceratina calcarata TaxID=156304 RepID=A0AAJ7N5W6_9HYME|nr:replication protein A 70 kDa DNA-binding subunit-like [Ceratina calcarata]